jgi:Mor family transcriptional regulator
MQHFDHHANELLADLARIATDMVKQFGELPDDKARLVGIEVAMQVAEEWGGHNIYIPQGAKLHIASRDLEVWELFTGNNHKDLARHFGMSEQWVYKIVKRVKKRITDEKQGKLF